MDETRGKDEKAGKEVDPEAVAFNQFVDLQVVDL